MRRELVERQRPLEFADQVLWQGWGDRRLMLARYEPGEEALLDLRDDFRRAWEAEGYTIPPGLRWTICDHHARPIAIGGLEPLQGPGCFGAWALASDMDVRAWAFARLCAAKVLTYAELELGAREIHAMACDEPGAIALLARLGFEPRDRYLAADGAAYLHMLRSF